MAGRVKSEDFEERNNQMWNIFSYKDKSLDHRVHGVSRGKKSSQRILASRNLSRHSFSDGGSRKDRKVKAWFVVIWRDKSLAHSVHRVLISGDGVSQSMCILKTIRLDFHHRAFSGGKRGFGKTLLRSLRDRIKAHFYFDLQGSQTAW